MDVKRRVNLCNSHEVYMLVLVRKLREPGTLLPPQQSDYAQDEWVHGPSAAQAVVLPRARRQLTSALVRLGLIDLARAWRERWRVMRASGIDLPPPDYQRIDLQQLLRPMS